MANNSTSFYVNLTGNLQANAARNAKSMEQMANRSTNAMGKIERSAFLATKGLRKLSGAINSAGNWAIAGAVGGTALASRSLIKTAAEFEMAAVRMKQNFGADGDKVFKWITDFATKTPMQFMDVQNAALSLKTAGIDPMNGSLQSLVDFNAKLGGNTENLNGMIATISKAYLKGKLTGEELQSLQEKKVPVLDLLAEASNGKYTKAQIADAITKGQIRINWLDALVKQMGLSSQGAAEAQMKTWDGMMSNIGDNITAMQAKLMQKGIFDELKNEVGNTLAWINEKMDNGEFDEFAKQVSDSLIAALKQLKDTAKEIQPVLKSIGDVIGWVTEKAGGFGNVAKFAAALYMANKVGRWGVTQFLGRNAIKGAGYLGGKLFGRGKGGATGVNGVLGSIAGVTPVYVTNFGSMAGMLGGKKGGKPKNKNRPPRNQQRTQKNQQRTPKTANSIKPAVQPKAQTTPKANSIKPAPQPKAQTTPKANSIKPAPQPKAQTTPKANSIKPAPQPKVQAVPKAITSNASTITDKTVKVVEKTAVKASKGVASVATQSMKSVARGASKAVPFMGTGVSLVEGAMVMMDDEASTADKSEAIGSIAGATAGAIIGQALIPVPVVGAVVGSMLGDWLGGWLGGEVGSKLSDPQPQETKLDGKINVKISAPEGYGVTATTGSYVRGAADSALQIATMTGYTGRQLYGGD